MRDGRTAAVVLLDLLLAMALVRLALDDTWPTIGAVAVLTAVRVVAVLRLDRGFAARTSGNRQTRSTIPT